MGPWSQPTCWVTLGEPLAVSEPLFPPLLGWTVVTLLACWGLGRTRGGGARRSRGGGAGGELLEPQWGGAYGPNRDGDPKAWCRGATLFPRILRDCHPGLGTLQDWWEGVLGGPFVTHTPPHPPAKPQPSPGLGAGKAALCPWDPAVSAGGAAAPRRRCSRPRFADGKTEVRMSQRLHKVTRQQPPSGRAGFKPAWGAAGA